METEKETNQVDVLSLSALEEYFNNECKITGSIAIDAYITLAMRTKAPLADAKADLVHAALGLGSEYGELLDAINRRKCKIQQEDGHSSSQAILIELGDIYWYMAIIGDHIRNLLRLSLGREEMLFGYTGEYPYPEGESALTGWLIVNRPSMDVVPECGIVGRIPHMKTDDEAVELLGAAIGNMITFIKRYSIYNKFDGNCGMLHRWLDIFETLGLVEMFLNFEYSDGGWAKIFALNIQKLAKRYPNKFTEADALLRRDVPETTADFSELHKM